MDRSTRGRWWALVAVVHAAVFGPVAHHLLFFPNENAAPNLFPTHTEFARTAFDGWWHLASPSQLWQATAKAFDLVLPGGIFAAAFVAALLFYAAFGIAIFEALRSAVRPEDRPSPVWALLAGLVVAMLESPAGLGGWTRFGTDGIFMPLYLPFAATTLASLAPNVLLMLQVSRWVDGRLPPRHRWTVPASVALAAFAKPTLVPLLIVVTPALVLVRQFLAPRAGGTPGAAAVVAPAAVRPGIGQVMGLLVAPAVAITLLQTLVTVRYVENRGGWVFSPLTELRDLRALTVTFWLVAVLPLVAIAVVRRPLLEDTPVWLASAGAVVGVVAALVLRRVGTNYQGDVLQLSEAAFAMLAIFVPRRVFELWRRREIAIAPVVVLGIVVAVYLVAGVMGWSCRVGLGCPAVAG